MPSVALIVALAAGCGGDGDGDGGERATTQLRPVNGSGASGSAELELDGRHLSVRIHARGLEPMRIHEQALHGFADAKKDATCPQGGGEGVLSGGEARASYGPRLATIEPYPTVGKDGELDYELTVTVDRDEVAPLRGLALVITGMRADTPKSEAARYFLRAPVACGTLEAEG